jgi:hypothetical protein
VRYHEQGSGSTADPLFGYHFARVWGTIALMARPGKPQFSGDAEQAERRFLRILAAELGVIDRLSFLRERALLMANLDWRNGLITQNQVISQARQYEAYLTGKPVLATESLHSAAEEPTKS